MSRNKSSIKYFIRNMHSHITENLNRENMYTIKKKKKIEYGDEIENLSRKQDRAVTRSRTSV